MVCCIVAALLVSLLQRLLPWRRRRTDVEPAFAPVAFRPAPGTFTPPPTVDVIAVTDVPASTTARLVSTVQFSALGTVAYLVTTAALVGSGAVDNTAATERWLWRTAVVLLLVLVAVVTVRRTAPGRRRLPTSELLGSALLGVGLPWLELTEVDMHLLHLYHVINPLLDFIFHSFGILVTIIGLVLLVPAPPQKEDNDVHRSVYLSNAH